jgi:type II secretory pathway pseudopilin PulG
MSPNPLEGSIARSTWIGSKIPVTKTLLGLIGCLIVGITAYSIYVASHEPDPQETLVLGQTKIASGSPASLRILVRNRVSGKPIKNARIELNLVSKGVGTIKLATAKTDESGSFLESINIPEIPPGEYRLLIDSSSSLGRDHVVKKVEIQHPARILLSSDKPIYQPGQTIHVRSLIVNGRTERPLTNELITFVVSDPKGNKVFKETGKTSSFGIASADFVLASELNIGRYEICALAGAGKIERIVEVKRYVLPKFKIQVTTDKPYYLPGETVSGSVTANYFFGKSVANAIVTLTAATFHEKPITLKELSGWTDSAGNYGFEFVLPDFFAGMPQMNGQAFLDLTAEVRDTAGHAEQKTLSLSVSQNELEITAIPEAGALVPGIENIVYVLTSYPDGRPAPGKVFVDGTAYQSDAQGLCEAKIVPADLNQQFEIRAIEQGGKQRKLTYHSETNRAPPAFLLRADKAVYQVGQTARISVNSAEKNDTIFLDVIKDGQTVLTKSIPLANHKAEYSLALPASLVGALKLNAYFITAEGEDRGCSRIIYVNPASALRIATSLSQPVYRPGEIARLDLSVTDAEGKPAPSALGIAAADESVFALHENRPGLLQQFLDAEGELLKPRYQIKFFDSPSRLFDTENQSLTKAYFASLEEPRAEAGLDELVRGGYVHPKLIEHAREMRGTPAYEKFRKDPQYADAFRLLEGSAGVYSLREATGPVKIQAVESHRNAYFKKLGTFLQFGLVGLLFLSPVFLLIYYSRPRAGIEPWPLGEGETDYYISVAGSLHNVLAALILLPLVCYPVGLLALEDSRVSHPGWLLLVFESVVVFAALFVQYVRTDTIGPENLVREIAPLRVFITLFLVQFVISRAGFLYVRDIDGFAMLWLIASIIASLMVLGTLNAHVRHQLVEKGITKKVGRLTLIEVLVIISIVAILSAMMLPALARAKARAQSINLLNDLKQIDMANLMAKEDGAAAEPGGAAPPRVRRDFPETLLWRPELITDDQGKATLEIPLADSITTWRASIDGINAAGKMGSVEMPITVFQDFFVDLDLPVSMSLGDQISVPVTCYNYLKEPQDVRFTLAADNWFESSAQNLSLHLGPSDVKSVSVPLKVLRVGNHTLRVTAQGSKTADAIERQIRVVPTGDRFDYTKNGVLKNVFSDTLTIPSGTIPESQSLWLKFYPSRFSEVVEGLESVFQAPYGCFEQTSSTTYPNVLVLDYMKRMGKLTPEIEIKARKYINAGYQRLLTFEVPGGGFEWFGNIPANICLTAYGILEFTDMARVHPVEEAVTERARRWLFGQQNSNGSWDEIHRGWTWGGRGSMTAFVAWALAEAGDQSPNLDRALSYLSAHPQELSNSYAKALAANAFLARDRNDTFGRQLANELKDAAIADDKEAIHWCSAGHSVTYSHGSGMDTECTALCVSALMKAGTCPQSVKQALTWISTHKFADGTHGSTQATILAMRALLEAGNTSLGQEFESEVTILLNGESAETYHITKENSDVMKQMELTRLLHSGENRILIRQTPAGELGFQLIGAYWLPTVPRSTPMPLKPEPLQITLRYDRTTLPVTEQLRCSVTARNNTRQPINMAIVDLGIPPGFDVDSTAFEAMRQNAKIAKFEITGNQVILYLREISNEAPFQFDYALRAKYPLRVQTPTSSVYEYYQPQNRAESKPVILQALAN